MDLLRQRLLELTALEQHAIVVEARYEDFLSPDKVHYWSAAFCARAIADLYAVFPSLRLVFCSNRKTAAEWTRSYFSAGLGRSRSRWRRGGRLQRRGHRAAWS
ncbi:MAG: hypothetical protein JO352_28690 [Chloroflexi bacterium]|nr:hypothetical protein [Chloroflexota bacterium]MBV9601525.1 hypothetical protein [Chloroflexota bacterium]